MRSHRLMATKPSDGEPFNECKSKHANNTDHRAIPDDLPIVPVRRARSATEYWVDPTLPLPRLWGFMDTFDTPAT
jgi:hypothetical protein